MVTSKMVEDILNEDKTDEEILIELQDKVKGMIKDRDDKCAAAKEQLIENLKVTADKYRTATGIMEALRVIRMVYGDEGYPIYSIEDSDLDNGIKGASMLANDMIEEVSKLVDKAENLEYTEMDKLCEDAYNNDFASSYISGMSLAFELMRLDLCRNVGPAAEDMVAFINRANEEIEATQAKIVEIQSKPQPLKDNDD